ncbi:MAG TPA: LPS export ABC transporter periplasmic protein LptC [Burkholderiaceae bacterium]|jgi:lipopolysaccharide export system protein LptC|nr:LPS export ABC transporter periplasmic protein LptC [Burkholderiaceae bacterium]
MRARLYDRLAALISVALLVALALFSYYLAELADRQHPVGAPRLPHEPDYFVEQFAITKMDADGAPAFRLEAERLRHYPDEQTIEFEQPRVYTLDEDAPRVTIRADHGRTTEEAVETHLYGNVVVRRQPLDGAPELRVETEYALVLSEQDIVRTNRPVRITQGGNVLTGVGMELDNRARQLRVDSDVRSVWTGTPGRPDRGNSGAAPRTAAGSGPATTTGKAIR